MPFLAFESQAAEQIGDVIYEAGHLRLVELQPGDERAQVQRLKAADPSLGRYVGIIQTLPPREERNRWRAAPGASTDEQQNIGRPATIRIPPRP